MCRNEGEPTLILASKILFGMKEGYLIIKTTKLILYCFVELLSAKAKSIGRG
jgi:hypothetical protein